VARLERRALRGLRACAAASGTSASAAPGPPQFAAVADTADVAAPLIATAGGRDTGRAPAPVRDGGRGKADDTGLSRAEGAVKGATAHGGGTPLGAVRAPPTAGLGVFLPMIAALLALVAFAVWWARRRGPLRL
jgi:hypothetical protein